MSETFTTIAEWQQKTFPKATPVGALVHIQRELYEIETAHVLDLPSGEVKEELADVFILWVAACHRFGFSEWEMDGAINAKMAKNRKRTWAAPDAQGVIEHVRGVDD